MDTFKLEKCILVGFFDKVPSKVFQWVMKIFFSTNRDARAGHPPTV